MDEKQSNIATKLNQLFETVRKPDGTRYSQKEVIAGTNGALTSVYLWKLRKGHATKPGYEIIRALANFFGVNPSYFFDDEEVANELLDQVVQSDLVDQITLRSSFLNEQGKQAVLGMIDYVLKSQKGRDDND